MEEAQEFNTRRYGRGHRIFVVETADEWRRGRWNEHCGILEKLGRRGRNSRYDESFETTEFTAGIAIRLLTSIAWYNAVDALDR